MKSTDNSERLGACCDRLPSKKICNPPLHEIYTDLEVFPLLDSFCTLNDFTVWGQLVGIDSQVLSGLKSTSTIDVDFWNRNLDEAYANYKSNC